MRDKYTFDGDPRLISSLRRFVYNLSHSRQCSNGKQKKLSEHQMMDSVETDVKTSPVTPI